MQTWPSTAPLPALQLLTHTHPSTDGPQLWGQTSPSSSSCRAEARRAQEGAQPALLPSHKIGLTQQQGLLQPPGTRWVLHRMCPCLAATLWARNSKLIDFLLILLSPAAGSWTVRSWHKGGVAPDPAPHGGGRRLLSSTCPAHRGKRQP